MAQDSDLEKTEPASPRRIEQAREEGNVPQSRELSSFLVLICGVGALWVTSEWTVVRVKVLMRDGLMLERSQAFDPGAMLVVLQSLIADGLMAIAPLLVVLCVAAAIGPLTVGGLVFSSKAFTPQFSRLNPLSGIKRILSKHGLVELIKGLLKTLLIGAVGAMVLWSEQEEILSLLSAPLELSLAHFGHMLLMASLVLVSSLAVVAAIDVPFQIWHYYDGLKMTKEEIKQEMKEQEGDPQIKAKIRARQREMARRRMMEAVPQADVVVTNPTHFAVALQYDSKKMGAPTVVAKGADLMAHAIRELASKHGVPLLETPPLARALYHHAEVGDQVPAALYTAVAEVMAYVYQLNHFLAQGGLPPETPHNLPVPPDLDPAAKN